MESLNKLFAPSAVQRKILIVPIELYEDACEIFSDVDVQIAEWTEE